MCGGVYEHMYVYVDCVWRVHIHVVHVSALHLCMCVHVCTRVYVGWCVDRSVDGCAVSVHLHGECVYKTLCPHAQSLDQIRLGGIPRSCLNTPHDLHKTFTDTL